MESLRYRTGMRLYVFFTVILWLKMALLRIFLFGGVGIRWWLLDLAGIVVLTGAIEALFRGTWKKPAYWTLNAVLSFIFFAAAVYFEHFGSVVTYTSVLEMKQLKQISSGVKATIDPADFLFFADIALALLLRVIVGKGARHRYGKREYVRGGFRKIALALLLVGFIAVAYAVKQDKGITNELVRAEQLGLLGYEVSVAVNGISEKKHAKITGLDLAGPLIEQLQASYGYGVDPQAAPAMFASQKGRNLIVVQMEAFQNFPIGLRLNGQEITPVLNRLREESYYFPHIFQQVGQGNTSDAEFMSNTSIYPTGTIPMSTGYGDRNLPSLPKLLEAIGYEADTFHVNEVHFWDRYKLYPAIGFTHYFDKPYYVNDQFNEFGASDEELFRVGVEKLAELHVQNKPFYAQFITVSSHFPFKVPLDRRKMTIPAALEGKQLGDYLLAVNYTDYAIGTLIDKLKAAGMWDDTVLVMYGDHFGLQPNDNDPAWVGEQLGITYHPSITRYNIPLFIRTPGQTAGQTIDQVGGQLDIMPTIANLLGISLKEKQFIHFGQDLLNIRKNAFGMRYYLPTGSFFNDRILFVPGKSFADGTATELRTLQPVPDINSFRDDYDFIMNLMEYSDDYVNLLPKRQE
ncbi:LTA synthase family protein [Paenibacillus hamazuiensis]|uniref:LTA synthase family protein n=1 Tax=Paenibacillus hamazuiensis TaxID=2936508 RepID=UPI00200E89E3|nr:LTA synthase family protein [Paenibacillus hamazuiensis]